MAKIYKGRDPYKPAVVQDNKTELDRKGVPGSLKSEHTFRVKNYFYRLFDHIGKQLNEANQAGKDMPGKPRFHRSWDFAK